ncbi:hypothetical protein MPL3356_60480 [Mesorhizobium plurifarium]|uniref:HK97 gp10 family phage protein n=1 Tax=Mesorhizobium plurifarium TaxID=69974 RepID=A0A090G6L3_MESPL|nr:hypothetical protein MPL3356_60480 [Mesorhizobium plurifarium]
MAKGFKLTGDVQLRANMRRAAGIYDGRAMDEDMEAALEPMRRETERNAAALRNFAGKYPDFFPQPSGSPPGGHVDENVVSVKVSGTAKRRTWWVSFKRRARTIVHLLEFGTAPHFQKNFRGGFFHPGSRAHPFFRPAFDSKHGEVIATLRRRAWLRLTNSIVRRR